ncbi:MAG: tail protein [Phage 66_12]|jgi:hypothetical protein|nr:MAG: tail protein [Phage 66_12]
MADTATVDPRVATPLASQGITKVYAVQHAQIAQLLTDVAGSAPTYGEWLDLPGIKSFKITGEMETKTLRGDNRLIDSQSVLTGMSASFEHAKISLIALQVMLGGSVPATKTVPYAGMGWVLPTSAFPKSFGLRVASAASDAPGGAVLFDMSRCSLSKFPELGAAEEDYQIVSAELNINPPVGTGNWLGITIVDTYTPPAPWAPDTST